MAVQMIDPTSLKRRLHDGQEIALLDVREHGEYGEAHLFYAVPLPYSRLEADIERLVPRRACTVVMYDDGATGVAVKAAQRAASYGYEDVHVLAGGTAAWRQAGFELFAGVHVPSKTFGEIVEHAEAVPSIAAPELKKLLTGGGKVVVVDGRPVEEYRKMNIPGSLCCPNGELVYRIGQIAADPDTTIVVNCAGRTRSIMGAATLRRFGVRNQVLALENGTMGWRLAGFDLEHGSDRLYPRAPAGLPLDQLKLKAGQLAQRYGVSRVDADMAAEWMTSTDRTTYLLDVRTEEEFLAGSLPGAVSAPGGQLLQATDQWLGVRNARVVLIDDNEVRAIVIASWLSQLGWETHVLQGGIEAGLGRLAGPSSDRIPAQLPELASIAAADLPALRRTAALVDVRPGMDYRAGHLEGAIWATRARLDNALRGIDGRPIVVIAKSATIGRAFASDLAEAGGTVAGMHIGSPARWREAGLTVEATPDSPSNAECIDYLFFVHDRHAGNLEAARQYIAWETGLVDRIDAQERAGFRIDDRSDAEAHGGIPVHSSVGYAKPD